MEIKITTFNVENLFNRYAFLDTPWDDRNYEKFVQAIDLVSVASRQGDIVPYAITEIQRNNTAQAIIDSAPDILAVQEVENLYTLRIFNDKYLDNYFHQMVLIDGNDPRGIDVGLMVKRDFPCEIVNIRTHVDDGVTNRSTARDFGYLVKGGIFSRDCLEVDIKINDKILTFLVNHFKAQDRNQSSVERRRQQAEGVVKLCQRACAEGKYPIVLGDFNMDSKNPQTPNDNSLDPLLRADLLKDPFPEDTWTHYYVPEKKISRLDYILPHKDLNVISTEIIHKGLTTKCRQYTGERYPTIGQEHTAASDHCPTSIVVEV